MLTTNKTRTLRAEFEKTKNAQFLSSRLWQEFGDKQRVMFDDFLKSKSNIFRKEHKYLANLYNTDDANEKMLFGEELYAIFQEFNFETLPSLKAFEGGVVLFVKPSEKKARACWEISDHELTAFIMFVVKKCNYDVIFIDNLYVENILAVKPDFFGNAIVKIAGK